MQKVSVLLNDKIYAVLGKAQKLNDIIQVKIIHL